MRPASHPPSTPARGASTSKTVDACGSIAVLEEALGKRSVGRVVDQCATLVPGGVETCW